MANGMVGDEWPECSERSDVQGDLGRLFEENARPMWVREGLEIVAVNRAALVHYGYSRDEFLALTINDLVATDAPGEPSVETPTTTNVAEHPPGLSKHRRKDGSVIDVEVTSFAVTFRTRPASLDSILNVTYRRKTEAQASYLEVLLATVTDAVVTSDENFVVTGWNAAAASTFGRRADEVVGQPDALVFRTSFIGVERDEATRRLVETGRFRGELTYRRRDGKRVHLESRAAALFDRGGKRLGYVSVNRDISERSHAEEAIRSLLKEVLAAQEVERRRIARELHDETAQTLTSLLIGLRAVEQSQDLGQALRGARTMRGAVSDALEGVRRMARGLRPSLLDDLGLEEALERVGLEMSRANDFVVDVQATGPRLPRLPEALEIALYRVVQEALTNASKHASPKVFSVLIHRNQSEVRLVIEDDGKGFDVSEIHSDAQLGLLGIRERVYLVGGSLTVESSPGHGTTICVSVSLPETESSSP
jgi:PAS domain S-box-containing protein